MANVQSTKEQKKHRNGGKTQHSEANRHEKWTKFIIIIIIIVIVIITIAHDGNIKRGKRKKKKNNNKEEGVVYREIGGKERKSSHDDDISDGTIQSYGDLCLYTYACILIKQKTSCRSCTQQLTLQYVHFTYDIVQPIHRDIRRYIYIYTYKGEIKKKHKTLNIREWMNEKQFRVWHSVFTYDSFFFFLLSKNISSCFLLLCMNIMWFTLHFRSVRPHKRYKP